MDRYFTVPFTGSGIILYVVYYNRAGLNVSVTLDGDFETINWFVLEADYTTAASYNSYNATLYDMQNLTYGDHEVRVQLQNYTGGLESTILFDYAEVTGTRSSSSSSDAKKRLGAGIGGALGTVAVLGAIALIFLFARRRSVHQRKLGGVSLRGNEDPFADPPNAKAYPASGNDVSALGRAKNAIDGFRPGHARRQSSFSQGAGSPISPVVPSYNKFQGTAPGGQKHPWLPLGEQ